MTKSTLLLFFGKKAFDTCNHSILLKKLSKLGIKNIELEWFRSYLTNRQQFVTIENCDSILLTILTGVPQGSILGPLLFLLYINDLPLSSDLFSLLFADDTALTASSVDIDNLFDFVNTEFHKLCAYFRRNKLSLHPDKTKYLLISPNSNLNCDRKIFINNNNNNENDQVKIFELQRVTNNDQTPAIKYLGVYFDSNLNFKYHISQVLKKLSYALYSLRSAKNIFSQRYLKTLYYSLFHCHLIYALEIWSSAPNSSLQPSITKQKIAIRLIAGKRYNDHTEPLFKQLSILPFTDLVLLSNLKFFHSYVYNYIPKAFSNTWKKNRDFRDNDDRELRNDDDFHITRHRTDYLARFPFFNLPKIWNETSNILTSTTHKRTFITNVTTHLLNNLSPNPNCSRLLCPACLTNNITNN